MNTLFIFFSILTVIAAMGVVISKTPVYSAFNLLICFFGLSGLYLFWGATFASVLQIFIYAGAIVVLIVFVLMLTQQPETSSTHHGWVPLVISGITVLSFLFGLLAVLKTTPNQLAPQGLSMSITRLSQMLFNEYLWPFEVLSVLLLAVTLCVYSLARGEDKQDDRFGESHE